MAHQQSVPSRILLHFFLENFTQFSSNRGSSSDQQNTARVPVQPVNQFRSFSTIWDKCCQKFINMTGDPGPACTASPGGLLITMRSSSECKTNDRIHLLSARLMLVLGISVLPVIAPAKGGILAFGQPQALSMPLLDCRLNVSVRSGGAFQFSVFDLRKVSPEPAINPDICILIADLTSLDAAHEIIARLRRRPAIKPANDNISVPKRYAAKRSSLCRSASIRISRENAENVVNHPELLRQKTHGFQVMLTKNNPEARELRQEKRTAGIHKECRKRKLTAANVYERQTHCITSRSTNRPTKRHEKKHFNNVLTLDYQLKGATRTLNFNLPAE